MIKITYNVPEHLEELFKGKKQSEIDALITSALGSSNMALVQNMCLDILFKVNEISSGTVVQTKTNTTAEAVKKADKVATQIPEQVTVKEDVPVKKVSNSKKKSGKNKFMAGVVR